MAVRQLRHGRCVVSALRLDGPDCTLQLGPTADNSCTRLSLVVQATGDDGRVSAGVQLNLRDVAAVAEFLTDWLAGAPDPEELARLQRLPVVPSRAALP
jgi:hypothetical protein